MPEPTRFAFVVGTGRCGSTLVQEILARHRSVGFLSNLEDRTTLPLVPASLQSYLYRRLPPSSQQKGRLRFAPSEGYRVLERTVSPILATPCRDLLATDATPWSTQRTQAFFQSRATRAGCPLFLHKFTGWPRAGFLGAALPDSRFVHVVRDGRAVANSWLQMRWWLGYRGPERWQYGQLPEPYYQQWQDSGRSFVALAGIGWEMLTDAFEEARSAAKPGTWLDVRYEDIVAEPALQFRAIADFLELEWDGDFAAQLARYRINLEPTVSYRQDLSPEHVEMLTSLLAEHLARWGYCA